MWWTVLLLACGGGGDTGEAECPDGDADGACDADDLCPGGDDTEDADGDGTPDGCQVDHLGGFSTIRTLVDSESDHFEVQLAFDTDGAMSTWKIFEPPLVVGNGDAGTAWTRELTGWEEVEDHLTDEVHEQFMVRIVGVEDGYKANQRYEEEERTELRDLEGVRDVAQVSASATEWQPTEDGLSLVLRWSFYGVP